MPPRLLPTAMWPKINYDDEFVPLNNTSVDHKMKSLVVNRGFIEEELFQNTIFDNIQLENYILLLIDSNNYNDYLERVFHLIEIWGGSAGRGLYQNRKNHNGFHWNDVGTQYKNIVNGCLSLKNLEDSSLLSLYNILNLNRISQVNVSYITKHVHFWTHKAVGNSMLPIYDNVISGGRPQVSTGLYNIKARWDQMIYYWKDMRDKAITEHMSLRSLDRLMFNVL